MRLMVEIDDKSYYDIKAGKVYSSIRDIPLEAVLAIANGTPYPKDPALIYLPRESEDEE